MSIILDDQYLTQTNETSIGDASNSTELGNEFIPSVTFPIGKITAKAPLLSSGVTYWFSLARSGAVDAGNYYLIGIGSPLQRANYQKFTPWTDPGNNFSLYFIEY